MSVAHGFHNTSTTSLVACCSLKRSPSVVPSLPPRLIPPVDLLLQDDTVHAGLEQGEDQASLALQLAQAVEDLGRGLAGHLVQR